MKVLLVNPPTFNYYYQLGAELPPLGLGYLGGMLKQEGHQVKIVDLDVVPEKERNIDFRGFDLVGITSDTPRYHKALKIATEAKKQRVPVVMGGFHVTFMDEEALSTGVVDYVVRGEGEYVLLNLVNALERDKDLVGIRGLSFLKKGCYRRNPDAPFIDNLDELPYPARELFPLDRYRSFYEGFPMTSMITSRGCPFDCSFCACSRFSGLKWRTRSLDSILKEMDHLQNSYGYHAFTFVDDNFTLNPKRVIAFAEEIKARKWNVRWWCFSRADTIVRNEDMVEKMAEAGARTVFLGLESGNQEVLDSYGKKITIRQQFRAIHMLKHYGIKVWGSFIIGARTETKEMIEKTIRLARKFKPKMGQFSILTPYPGTELFNCLKRENKIITYNWDYYDGAHAVIKTEFLSPRELQKLLVKAYRRFYLRFSNFARLVSASVRKKVGFKTSLKSFVSAIRISRHLLRTAISSADATKERG